MLKSENQTGSLAGVPRPVKTGRAYYPALDGLRALAFLLVFFSHYLVLPWGWVGVEIFFVLSGFLITGILCDTRDDLHRFRNFYLRRTLRIFPLYWGTLTVVLCIGLLMHARLSLSFAAWPLYVGNMLAFLHPSTAGSTFGMMAAGNIAPNPFVHNFSLQIGHLWSLCVEEQFYLFWPAVIFLVRGRVKLIWICVGFLLICPIARTITAAHAPAWLLQVELLKRFMPFRIDAFAYGGLLALLRRGHRLPSLKRPAEVYLGCGLILSAFLFRQQILAVLLRRPYIYQPWELTWGLVLGDSLCLALLILTLDPGSRTYKTLKTPLLRWFGRISYGAYVFHYIIIGANAGLVNALPVKHKLLPMLLIPLAFTTLLAWLSFRYFETPFIRLKNRFAT